MGSRGFTEVSESSIVHKIIKFLKKEYPGVWWKIHGGPYQQRGIPDIIGCYNGTFCGLEVKRPAKKNNTTPGQEEQLNLIAKYGGISAVVTSVEETKKVMEDNFSEKTI